MTPPGKETIETLAAIEKEIIAGRAFADDRDSRIWNAAHDRALLIVQNYRNGKGLAQLSGTIQMQLSLEDVKGPRLALTQTRHAVSRTAPRRTADAGTRNPADGDAD